MLSLCNPHISIDPKILYQAFKVQLAVHKNELSRDHSNRVLQLEDKWYCSLENLPDYSVYSEPYYFCDIWLCWTQYSRKSVMALADPKSLLTQSVIKFLGPVKTVVDLGCGFGYTTAGLKELFPQATVVGTNLPESFQFSVANRIGVQRRFSVIPNADHLQKVDVAFASEYFEHFESPLEHLHQLMSTIRPRCFVIANGFNGRAIGHFNFYKYRDQKIPKKTMSKWFNDSMRFYGYEKLKTKIWNNRPAIWVRK